MTIALNELWTGVAALATILLGVRINRWMPVLTQYSIPPAVTGGLSIAVLLAVLGLTFDFRLTFGETLRNALLLIFFAALGLTAKFRRLKSGGAAVAGLCVLIAVLAVAQSAAGVAIATAFGKPAALGVFLGSVAFLGGHGTTVAWAESEQAMNLPYALEIGMVCATLGLVAGAIVSGIVGTKLVEHAERTPSEAAVAEAPEPEWPQGALDSDRWITVLLWLAISVGLGLAARPVVNAALGATVPSFLAVLLAAVAAHQRRRPGAPPHRPRRRRSDRHAGAARVPRDRDARPAAGGGRRFRRHDRGRGGRAGRHRRRCSRCSSSIRG